MPKTTKPPKTVLDRQTWTCGKGENAVTGTIELRIDYDAVFKELACRALRKGKVTRLNRALEMVRVQ